MASKKFTTLDYIDNIKVYSEVFIEPSNEYWELLCIKHGLEYLYQNTLKYEERARSIINPQNKYKVLSYGNDPALKEIPKDLLTCFFHWYAISACQYVRTIGTIAYRLDNNNLKPIEYLSKVIPEIKEFRDKVAAHFAWSTKNRNDNDAERIISILPPVTYSDGNWEVGSFVLNIRKDGKNSSSEKIAPWSITKEHIKLRKRYWQEK